MMIIKVKKMDRFLKRLGWSPCKFADLLDIERKEVYRLLSGEAVGVHTARKFINFFKAEFARSYINWKAMKSITATGDIQNEQATNILQKQSIQNFCQA